MIKGMIILHGVAGVGKGHVANVVQDNLEFAKELIPDICSNNKIVIESLSLILKRDIMHLLAIDSAEQLNKFKVNESKMFEIKHTTLYTLIEQVHGVIKNNKVMITVQRIFGHAVNGKVTMNVRVLHQRYADLLKALTVESIFVDELLSHLENKYNTIKETIIVIDDLRYYVESEALIQFCKQANIPCVMCNVYGNSGYNLSKHSSEFMLDKIDFDKYIYNSKEVNIPIIFNRKPS